MNLRMHSWFAMLRQEKHERRKKINIFFCPSNTKSIQAKRSKQWFFSFTDFTGLHAGILKLHIIKANAETLLNINCMLLDFHPNISTVHMAAMNDCSPNRIGGSPSRYCNSILRVRYRIRCYSKQWWACRTSSWVTWPRKKDSDLWS